jgi:hypothetical protein
LAVPDAVTPDALEILARCRWPRATWEPSGALRLSRYSHLAGPYGVPPGLDGGIVAACAEHGAAWDGAAGRVFAIVTLRERGDQPFPGAMDPTGLARAFPEGLPVREEDRVVRWAWCVAQRVGGAIRLDPSELILAPDPASAVDLAVYSSVWLDPAAALTVARQAMPGFELDAGLEEWHGPARGNRVAADGLGAGQAAFVERVAEAHDAQALADDVVLSGYGMRCDLGPDGAVWLEAGPAGPARGLPPAIAGLAWAAAGVVRYRMGWLPYDADELLVELPDEPFRRLRAQMRGWVGTVARAVQAATGGEILDGGDFPVAPADL